MKEDRPFPNQMQARHLHERIKEKERELYLQKRALAVDAKAPIRIMQARAMISKWDTAECRRTRKVRDALDGQIAKEVKKIREIVLFAKPAEALEAMKTFEAFKLKAPK